MKLYIKAKPVSHSELVEKIDETHFVVSVQEPPQNGLANKGIVKALSGYFGAAPSRIKIIKGFTSKNKVVEIF